MPEMEQKTPIYDVLVWMIDGKDPIRMVRNVTYEVAADRFEKLAASNPPRIAYREDGNATKQVDSFLVKAHVVRATIRRAMITWYVQDGAYGGTWPESRDAFLEDLTDET